MISPKDGRREAKNFIKQSQSFLILYLSKLSWIFIIVPNVHMICERQDLAHSIVYWQFNIYLGSRGNEQYGPVV